MPSVRVIVKWNGQDHELDLDTDDSAEVFKAQLFAMTSVPPDRQKILFKGKTLTEDSDLNALNIKEGSKFMMMGTPELPREPEERTLFLEDMTDKQLAETLKLPSGLQNLGNTCYMNSTLQFLRAMPELQDSLNKFTGGPSGAENRNANNLTTSLRNLYRDLSQTTEAAPPFQFLQVLRDAFPQFAQRNAHGFMQQDAEECWSQVVSSLKQANIPIPNQSSDGEEGSSTGESFVDRYMTGEFTTTFKCQETEEEEETSVKEPFVKLNCHISIHVNYMQYGIKDALDERIDKTSPTLERTAQYRKTSLISRLPSYLTVQFVRFFWKSEKNVKTKILRKVKFPMELDATEFCTDELKNKIAPLRNRLSELEKDRESAKKKEKLAKSNDDQDTANSSSKDETVDVEELKKLIHPDLEKDVGANVSGLYDLCAVLTHIGRSAEVGHYIGWVRKENSDDWFQFDDDKVRMATQEDIQKLDGGGDWHIAYILLYRSKKIA